MDIENPIFINNNNNNNNNPIAIPVAHVITVEVPSVRVDYVDVDDEQIIDPRKSPKEKYLCTLLFICEYCYYIKYRDVCNNGHVIIFNMAQ